MSTAGYSDSTKKPPYWDHRGPERHVWYTVYGSNLNHGRFYRYIMGGQVPGSNHVNPGCTDRTPPLASHGLTLPHQLRFAGRSLAYAGGVAFLSPNRKEGMAQARQAKCAAYLIGIDQFWDVFAQENNLPDTERIPLDDVIQAGTVRPNNTGDEYNNYDSVVYLGQHGVHAMLTLTSGNTDLMEPVAPHETYLRTIAHGLQSVHYMDIPEISAYFASIPGVDGNYSMEDISLILKEDWVPMPGRHNQQ